VSALSRRRFLQGTALLPLAALLPRGMLDGALAATKRFRYFDDHAAAVVREATARLIPGPEDDPAEIGHPGAREANVVRYIDLMLSAFRESPPRVFAGGPFSDRSGGKRNDLARFLPLSRLQTRVWKERIARLREQYREGVALLDSLAGGDFAAGTTVEQDQALSDGTAGAFRDLLFTHAIEGTYSIPEYGGNAERSGWEEIGFEGDRQPRGYSAEEVSESDGPDPVNPTVVVAALLERFDDAAVVVTRRKFHGP
jgi:hypothetical protein